MQRIERITSPNPGRYCGRNSRLYKKLQQVEDLEQLHNESIFDLVKPPFKAKSHIHNIAEGGFVAVCDCGNFVFNNQFHTDVYCSECGRKIDWSDLDIKEYVKNKKKLEEELFNEKISDNI